MVNGQRPGGCEKSRLAQRGFIDPNELPDAVHGRWVARGRTSQEEATQPQGQDKAQDLPAFEVEGPREDLILEPQSNQVESKLSLDLESSAAVEHGSLEDSRESGDGESLL